MRAMSIYTPLFLLASLGLVLREHSNDRASDGPDSIFPDAGRTKLRKNELRTDRLATLFALCRLMHWYEAK